MSAPTRISAYVPCYNNAATLCAAVESVLRQTVPPDEVLVVDDGSTDGSVEKLAGLPVRVFRQGSNFGRGAARARAMLESQYDLVLCCDATNRLPPEFAQRALAWLDERRVAAAFGPIRDPAPRGVVDRWRARHLFKQGGHSGQVDRRAMLATYGMLLRRSAVESVGGFNPVLRHSEDSELGVRLLAANCDVVFDPQLITICNVRNSLVQVLERYWRWYVGQGQISSVSGYWAAIRYSIAGMVREDLRAHDIAAAGISLLCPHYQFWKSAGRRWQRA